MKGIYERTAINQFKFSTRALGEWIPPLRYIIISKWDPTCSICVILLQTDKQTCHENNTSLADVVSL